MDHGNKEEAERCLGLARKVLMQGGRERARILAKTSMKLSTLKECEDQ